MLFYIFVKEGQIDHTDEIVPDLVNVDRDKDGNVLGIEILGGDRVTIEEERGAGIES